MCMTWREKWFMQHVYNSGVITCSSVVSVLHLKLLELKTFPYMLFEIHIWMFVHVCSRMWTEKLGHAQGIIVWKFAKEEEIPVNGNFFEQWWKLLSLIPNDKTVLLPIYCLMSPQIFSGYSDVSLLIKAHSKMFLMFGMCWSLYTDFS